MNVVVRDESNLTNQPQAARMAADKILSHLFSFFPALAISTCDMLGYKDLDMTFSYSHAGREDILREAKKLEKIAD